VDKSEEVFFPNIGLSVVGSSDDELNCPVRSSLGAHRRGENCQQGATSRQGHRSANLCVMSGCSLRSGASRYPPNRQPQATNVLLPCGLRMYRTDLGRPSFRNGGIAPFFYYAR